MVQTWSQHQAVEAMPPPRVEDPQLQAFISGLLVGAILIIATLLLWRRRPRALRRGARQGALITGWGDLFRLIGALARGAVYLVIGFLLVARVLFWPAGRRW
jgi:hypothetical protein